MRIFLDENGVVWTIEVANGQKSLRSVTYVVPLELDCSSPGEEAIRDGNSDDDENEDKVYQLGYPIS